MLYHFFSFFKVSKITTKSYQGYYWTQKIARVCNNMIFISLLTPLPFSTATMTSATPTVTFTEVHRSAPSRQQGNNRRANKVNCCHPIGLILVKEEGRTGVTQGLAGLLQGVSQEESPREILRSSSASPKKTLAFLTHLLGFTFYVFLIGFPIP